MREEAVPAPAAGRFVPPDEALVPGLAALERDLAAREPELREAIQGRSLLLVGGAGTIGAATLREVLPFAPARITVADPSENGLAELVRSLRASEWPGGLPELEFLPLDFTTPLFGRVVRERAFDHVLSFAALKHVRSERDGYSIARMLQVNVLALRDLLRTLARSPAPPARVFSVSTDKAADPAGVMGASKRLMEAVLAEGGAAAPFACASARFANVAFSAGSLPESWLLRMARGQPLACPEDTFRFLVRQRDAGRICLLSAFCLDAGQVAVPSAAAGVEEYRLQDLAVDFLASRGFEAEVVTDEARARASVEELAAAGRYPLLLTPRDTMGEKRQEVFLGAGESRVGTGLESLDALTPAPLAPGALDALEERLAPALGGGPVPSREAFLAWLPELLPGFRHAGGGPSLDDRM